MADRGYRPATIGDDVDARRPPRLAGGLLVGANAADVVAAYPNTKVDHFVIVTGAAIHRVDITGWVWLHVAVGVAAVLAGLVVVADRRGAAGPVGIACAALASAIGIVMLPYAPIRAALVISFNAAAIGLLMRHRRSRLRG
ncbi:MAG TPA: hypothetical protein VHN18_08175 [Micromonosporaceae bacterium]|nr:hypothetical protein [Micromonosporaceae bacterium]